MWGHLLPMTIVVLSHILSISPSAAAPQNFILPRVSDIIPRDGKSYDETSSSWEESISNDEKNYPLLQSSNLIDAAILLNGGIPNDLIDDGEQQEQLVLDGNNNPKTISSAFDHTIRTRPVQGLWNLMSQDGTVDDNQRRLDQQDGGSSNFWIHKPIRELAETRDNVPMVTFIRNEKRSPRCLRKCLAQGLLHPSQCHSLC